MEQSESSLSGAMERLSLSNVMKLDSSTSFEYLNNPTVSTAPNDEACTSLIIQLKETYRAHKHITGAFSSLFYGGGLVASAPPAVANQCLGWSALPNPAVPLWFRHVEGLEAREADSPSWYNQAEMVRVSLSRLWREKCAQLFRYASHCTALVS